MKETSPRAELVQECAALNKIFNSKYNHLVDTNEKILGQNFSKVTNLLKSQKIELYTTRHLVSAVVIYDFINEYIERRNMQRP